MKSWELEQMWKRVAREEGLAEGKQEGRQQFIFDLLEELGQVPKVLQEKISSESDADTLARWHKLAAKANSILEFEQKM